jgi:ERCC4-related helicase
VQIKFLSGADGVDRWTEQRLWDSILSNVRVVVSTYQILADALTHGFVKIESLALIVFDEGGLSLTPAAMNQQNNICKRIIVLGNRLVQN